VWRDKARSAERWRQNSASAEFRASGRLSVGLSEGGSSLRGTATMGKVCTRARDFGTSSAIFTAVLYGPWLGG